MDMEAQLGAAHARVIIVEASANESTQLRAEVARLRGLRDLHRQKGERLINEVAGLKIDKANLEKEVQGFQARRGREQYDLGENSNDEYQYQPRPRPRSPTGGRRQGTRILSRGEEAPSGLFPHRRLSNNYFSFGRRRVDEDAFGQWKRQRSNHPPQDTQYHSRPRPKKYPKLPEFYGVHEE